MDLRASDKHDEILQLGTFYVDDEEFGIDILKLREIIRIMEITKVPRSESFVEGAINLRGVIIPVINLRKRFGLPSRPFDKETRIFNIEVNDMILGFIVDSVGQVRRIPVSLVEPPPAIISSVEAEYISGVAKIGDELLILLDISKLFSEEMLENLTQL